MRQVLGVVLMMWLVVGTMAAQQRGIFGQGVSCDAAATTAVTAAAGPLNYYGVSPRVTCPQPSQ
jgi:hypothetical protein